MNQDGKCIKCGKRSSLLTITSGMSGIYKCHSCGEIKNISVDKKRGRP